MAKNNTLVSINTLKDGTIVVTKGSETRKYKKMDSAITFAFGKVEAPKKKTAPKKTYEEVMTEKYGDKAHRTLVAQTRGKVCQLAYKTLGQSYYKVKEKDRVEKTWAIAHTLVDSGKKITDKAIIALINEAFEEPKKVAAPKTKKSGRK